MKRIVVRSRPEDAKAVESVIAENVYYVVKGKDVVTYTLYVLDSSVDGLITSLRDTIDLRYKDSLIEVMSPDFVISSSLERDSQKKQPPEKTPVEKLMHSVQPYSSIDLTKLLLVSIAGLVALTGLFLDNVAVIIGAMLLSPLLGPIYAFIIYVVTGKTKKAFSALSQIIAQIILLIALSALTTYILGLFIDLSITNEILLRVNTSAVYVVMAILLGFAAVLAYTKGISESVAGIAIAAALVPPAVVTGIMFVLDRSHSHIPFALTLDNILGLIIGGLIATIVLGIVPRSYYERCDAKKILQRMLLALIILLVLLVMSSYI